MTPDRIPATIVTGFLGAGKTTLIRNLIAQARGRRIAIIVNEFGDMGFDGDLLSDCGDADCRPDEIVELTNGCICCTVADEFLPTMEALLARDPAPDHIVIETSGLALPQPLVQAFQWPAVKSRVTVDGVVTVADSAALAEGRIAGDLDAVDAQRAADPSLDHDDPVEELFEDQLRCADLIVLSKADLLADDRRAAVHARVREDARPAVKIIEASNGDIALAALLGIGAAAEDDMESRHDHHHESGEEHDHDEFESFALDMAAAALPDLKARVERAMALPGVLRIKGRARIDGKAAPAVVQAVGPRVDAYFSPDAGSGAGLVVIGLAPLDRDAIRAVLAG